MSHNTTSYDLNLASSPFINLTVPGILAILLGICILAFTAFNATVLISAETDLQGFKTQISNTSGKMDELKGKIDSMDNSLSKINSGAFMKEIDYINALIDRRSMSWTRLFNKLEDLTPSDLKMHKITPSVRSGNLVISFRVEVPRLDSVRAFITALESSDNFTDIQLRSQNPAEGGNQFWDMTVIYLEDK